MSALEATNDRCMHLSSGLGGSVPTVLPIAQYVYGGGGLAKLIRDLFVLICTACMVSALMRELFKPWAISHSLRDLRSTRSSGQQLPVLKVSWIGRYLPRH